MDTYIVELASRQGGTFLMFADPVLKAIFAELQQIDDVGDSEYLKIKIERLNAIIEPFGFTLKKNELPNAQP